jgi:hypothetical protein
MTQAQRAHVGRAYDEGPSPAESPSSRVDRLIAPSSEHAIVALCTLRFLTKSYRELPTPMGTAVYGTRSPCP